MSLRVELLIIGNEILSGHTQDTNSYWLTIQLRQLHLLVQQITVIPDHVEAIDDAIKTSCHRGTFLLITSGGLGPTFDDCTAQALAKATGTSLELNQSALQMVKERYKLLHQQKILSSPKITPSRRKMAILPKGAIPLPNSVGTAPAIYLQYEHTHIYCLPGVPQELKSIFNEEIRPRISNLASHIILEELVTIPLLDESSLAPILEEIMKTESSVYLKSLPRPYQKKEQLVVAITITADSKQQAQKILNRVKGLLAKLTARS
jgi:molybdenum cofactor synthesis domain-containing protein